MFITMIVSHKAQSSHELDRTIFLHDAVLTADHFARHWHDPLTTFEVWRGGNCFHTATPPGEPPIKPGN